jgi:hypothetical protein
MSIATGTQATRRTPYLTAPCYRNIEPHAVDDRSIQLDGILAALPLPAVRQVFLADAIAVVALACRQLFC